VQVGSNFYFYPVGGSSGPLFKYSGSAVAVGQYEWSCIGVEQTAGGYQVALRVAGTDQYTVWNTDSNGNVVSNGTGGVVVSGSSTVLKSLEPSFHQDLNGDGVIGGAAPPAPSGTVIESFGSTSLVQVGSNFYFYPVGGSSGPLFKYSGSAVAVGQYEWSYIGVEQTAGGYQVALRVAGTDQYTVWNTDSNGNVVSNGTGGVVVSGASSVLKALEPSFHQDLNGDGSLGAAVISGFAGGDSFKFNSDPLEAHPSVASPSALGGHEIPETGWQNLAQAVAASDAGLHSSLIDALTHSHSTDALFGHVIIQ
jgi:serralysin